MPFARQIMLIPQERYWEWVQAAREYVVEYGITMTPNPSSAARFCGDEHIVTIILFPGAWPRDIVGWFRENHPAVRLDLIEVQEPVVLKEILQQRIASQDRFGEGQPAFRLTWPTDYEVVIQAFGANPTYYRRFGLPGHEGVDIRAPLNSPIYACAPGRVYRVHDGKDNHPYGLHIRIRHARGFKTVYAHLNRLLVAVGDLVVAGQRIGLAGSSGNSSASHLHLTLKHEGATAAGETSFPLDVIDPTPFFLSGTGVRTPEWGPGCCLVGVHGRTDGPLQSSDFAPIQVARLEAVKVLVNADPAGIDRCRQINPEMFFLARLYADFRDGRLVSPDAFAEWQQPDMERLYAGGVRYFEVHNEPNLISEGYGVCWQSGREFEAWFLRVVEILRPLFPEARFGFPGCSPGTDIWGKREDMWRFLEQCETAIAMADWIGVHAYWMDGAEMRSPADGMGFLAYQRRWPDKLLFITEFSNPSPRVDMQTKGQQYVNFYRQLRHRSGIGAAFAFALSASTDFPHEVWRREDGQMTAIPTVVGGRNF